MLRPSNMDDFKGQYTENIYSRQDHGKSPTSSFHESPSLGSELSPLLFAPYEYLSSLNNSTECQDDDSDNLVHSEPQHLSSQPLNYLQCAHTSPAHPFNEVNDETQPNIFTLDTEDGSTDLLQVVSMSSSEVTALSECSPPFSDQLSHGNQSSVITQITSDETNTRQLQQTTQNFDTLTLFPKLVTVPFEEARMVLLSQRNTEGNTGELLDFSSPASTLASQELISKPFSTEHENLALSVSPCTSNGEELSDSSLLSSALNMSSMQKKPMLKDGDSLLFSSSWPLESSQCQMPNFPLSRLAFLSDRGPQGESMEADISIGDGSPCSPDQTFEIDSNKKGKGREKKDDCKMKLSMINCNVCDQPAGKHNYYGGNVCHSCRTFFRRSVMKGDYSKFGCKWQNSCKIDSKSWRSCRKCRFQKCIDIGMKASYVLNSSECKSRAIQRKQKTEVDTRRVEVKDMLDICSDEMSIAEFDYLKELAGNQIRTLENGIIAHCSKRSDVYQSFLSASFLGSTIPYYSVKFLEETHNMIAREILTARFKVHSWSQKNLEALVQNNYPLMEEWGWLITTSIGQISHKEHGLAVKNWIRDHAHKNGKFKRLLEKVNYFSNFESLAPKPVSYEQIYKSPWAASEALEMQHKKLFQKIQRLWEQEFAVPVPIYGDVILFYLFFELMLFSIDKAPLEDKAIEKVYYSNSHRLYRYFKFKYGRDRAAAKLGHAVSLCSHIREASQIRECRLPV